LRIDTDPKRVLMFLVLFVSMGFIMDLVHEFSHWIFGMAVGGKLIYMKITWFEIYPKPALASTFDLGLVNVAGLTSDFSHGIMSLGGSLTTNIIAWIVGLFLMSVKFGHKTRISLKFLGLLGILDLPMYVVLPQIGLKHWIFIGGSEPEPLWGARKVGLPDPLFYILVGATTLGLAFLYFRPILTRVAKVLARCVIRNNMRFHRDHLG